MCIVSDSCLWFLLLCSEARTTPSSFPPLFSPVFFPKEVKTSTPIELAIYLEYVFYREVLDVFFISLLQCNFSGGVIRSYTWTHCEWSLLTLTIRKKARYRSLQILPAFLSRLPEWLSGNKCCNTKRVSGGLGADSIDTDSHDDSTATEWKILKKFFFNITKLCSYLLT